MLSKGRIKKWLRQLCNRPSEMEVIKAFICEESDSAGGDPSTLSLIDIKAAIAQQHIPVSELYSAQDLAANRVVMQLVRDAENTIERKLNGEIVLLKEENRNLRAFKDQRQVVELVASSKLLSDKSAKLVSYMKKRFSTGKLVDLSGDLTDSQRQEKINEAIQAELSLVDEMGIDFKEVKKGDGLTPSSVKTPFDDEVEAVDYTDPKNNPLIPSDGK